MRLATNFFSTLKNYLCTAEAKRREKIVEFMLSSVCVVGYNELLRSDIYRQDETHSVNDVSGDVAHKRTLRISLFFLSLSAISSAYQKAKTIENQ